MGKAFLYSILLHAILIAGLIWSDKIYLQFIKASHRERQIVSATLLMDKSYKPTDTAMKKGTNDKNLPPPKIEPPKKEDLPEVSKKLKKSKTQEKKPDGKKALKDILNKIRKDSAEEKRPPPKEKNFPTHEKGEKNAHGTGGWAERTLSPAEQALQAAMRKYYEVEGADAIKKKFPDAKGYLALKLVGVGNQFQIVSLVLSESTGFNIVDRKCEVAVRQAIDQETFAKDVITELTGKETQIICQP
ncbi:MAG: hypothetical protein JWQ35_2757 [Bacteriovoracaceae bacterium]|nr:hypothetical protein [Bacteriovoracaceae bacterium]